MIFFFFNWLFLLEKLPGSDPGWHRSWLHGSAVRDPDADQRPGGTDLPDPGRDRMPERRIWAAAERQDPPGDGDWDLPPPAGWRGRVNDSQPLSAFLGVLMLPNQNGGWGLDLGLKSHSDMVESKVIYLPQGEPPAWRVRPAFANYKGTQFLFSSSSSGFGGSDFRNLGSRNTGSRNMGSRDLSVSGDSRSGSCSGQGRGKHILMFVIVLSFKVKACFACHIKSVQGHLGGSVSWVSDFGSGCDLTVHEFKPYIGLSAMSTEQALDPLSPSLSAPPSLPLPLSLKNKH